MQVVLNSFLRTGNLGELQLGMSKEEIRELLGEPNATGGESRRYPYPSLLLYGTVELNFEQKQPWGLTSLWWEAGEKGAFQISPACEILDWAFTPAWSFAQVDAYLEELALPRTYPAAPGEEMMAGIVLESGVRISFREGKLYGIWR